MNVKKIKPFHGNNICYICGDNVSGGIGILDVQEFVKRDCECLGSICPIWHKKYFFTPSTEEWKDVGHCGFSGGMDSLMEYNEAQTR